MNIERVDKIQKLLITEALKHIRKYAKKYTPKNKLFYPLALNTKTSSYLHDYFYDNEEYNEVCEDCVDNAEIELNKKVKLPENGIIVFYEDDNEKDDFCNCHMCGEIISLTNLHSFSDDYINNYLQESNKDFLKTIKTPYNAYKIYEMLNSEDCYKKHNKDLFKLAKKINDLFKR